MAPISEKYPLRVLAICSNYEGTSLFLPGVNIDKLNLYQFTQTANASLRMLENPSKNDIYYAIETFQPTVIWMCGHGVLNSANENVYIVDGGTLPARVPQQISLLKEHNKLTEPEFIKRVLLNASKRRTTLYIFDFCHSCTMLDLPYFYENGFFYKKLANRFATISQQKNGHYGHDKHERYDKQSFAQHDDNEHMFIAISGCSDFETTEEDAEGGLLTQRLLYLLRSKRALTLELLDTSLTNKARISVSKPIDPMFEFCRM